MLARAGAWFEGSSDRICGGTFHAIAHKIIRQHAESFSLPPQFTILDQGDATDLLDVLRPDHGLDGTGQRAPRAAACADIYTSCVNTGRPVSEVVTAGFPWCKPFTAQLAALFRAYTARKRARNLLDFDDLLLLWQAALADPAAGPVLRGMFDAVLVDEYQDVNAVQASIVRLLQPDGKQLTCVGDDAQAIYGFRGADPAHLRQLTADYPGLDIVRLDRNYRSRQGVLDLANVIRPSYALPGGARGGSGFRPPRSQQSPCAAGLPARQRGQVHHRPDPRLRPVPDRPVRVPDARPAGPARGRLGAQRPGIPQRHQAERVAGPRTRPGATG
jgi:DNA helicase-2/ATP-dependent DNA helicase PcrA